MKKGIIFLFLLVMVCFISIGGGKFYDGEKVSKEVYKELNEKGKTKVIVKLKEIESRGSAQLHSASYEKKQKILQKAERKYKNLVVLEVTNEELELLKESNEVESISKLHYIKAMLQDSVNIVNASKVWPLEEKSLNITGTGETICVIDTGINYTHPDLVGKSKLCNLDCYRKDVCEENCSLWDDGNYSHGTHVAGIIAASGGIIGIAPNVNFIGMKVFNESGDATDIELKRAIEWCVENRNLYNISVITMSLGTEYPYLYETHCDDEWDPLTGAINNATFYNISVIAASGNDWSSTAISWPACISNVSAVGATNKDDSVASYSNFNAITDFFAPGTNINSTCCINEYEILSGTSMATPHVAAAFALIRQFYFLQKGVILTPKQIENVLKQTGKNITTSTGVKIPRINVYNAIISLDENAPNVSLISPSNGSEVASINYTFRCNATDLSLKNVSFYLWNSSSIVNYSSKSITGASYNYEINITNLNTGSNYKWNCYFVDENNNIGFFASNFSLIANISVNLASPSNELSAKENQTFVCNANSVNELKNVSFYLWNESSLEYNESKEITGINNGSSFYYNFTKEGRYTWNCYFVDEYSYGRFYLVNFSVVYDLTKPNITLIEPEEGYSETASSKTMSFLYNASDNFDIENCSLIINNQISESNNSINQSFTQSFTKTLNAGSYSWGINCSDKAGNFENSSLRTFVINAPVVSSGSSGGGGGGGGGQIASVFYPSNEELISGYKKELRKDEKIKFYDSTSKEHTLKIKEIGKEKVNLTIESSPVFLSLKIGESAKLNLTSSDYYELYIKLEDIVKEKAVLFVQLIKEKMFEEKSVFENETKIESNISTKIENFDNKKENGNEWGMIKVFVYVVLLFLVAGFVIYLLDLRNRKKAKKKSRKK